MHLFLQLIAQLNLLIKDIAGQSTAFTPCCSPVTSTLPASFIRCQNNRKRAKLKSSCCSLDSSFIQYIAYNILSVYCLVSILPVFVISVHCLTMYGVRCLYYSFILPLTQDIPHQMSTQWVGVGIRPNIYFVIFSNWQTTERERGWPNVVTSLRLPLAVEIVGHQVNEIQ